MHFGELELQSSILASSPPRPLSKSGKETATSQSYQRHLIAMHMRYDALCVVPINRSPPIFTTSILVESLEDPNR